MKKALVLFLSVLVVSSLGGVVSAQELTGQQILDDLGLAIS